MKESVSLKYSQSCLHLNGEDQDWHRVVIYWPDGLSMKWFEEVLPHGKDCKGALTQKAISWLKENRPDLSYEVAH